MNVVAAMPSGMIPRRAAKCKLSIPWGSERRPSTECRAQSNLAPYWVQFQNSFCTGPLQRCGFSSGTTSINAEPTKTAKTANNRSRFGSVMTGTLSRAEAPWRVDFPWRRELVDRPLQSEPHQGDHHSNNQEQNVGVFDPLPTLHFAFALSPSSTRRRRASRIWRQNGSKVLWSKKPND